MPGPSNLYPSLRQLCKSARARLSRSCDLFTHPIETPSIDPLAPERLTQLLYGESVELLAQACGWLQVRAHQQPTWNEEQQQFVPYVGWIQEQLLEGPQAGESLVVSSLSAVVRQEPSFDSPAVALPEMGSFLISEGLEEGWHRLTLLGKRGWIYDKDIAALDWMQDQGLEGWRWQWLESALRFRSAYYLLGGLGLTRNAKGQRGIDCSGLTHLTARRLGLILPRDSKDQYRWLQQLGYGKSQPLELEPGDLLFLSARGPESIDHVMIYHGDEEWIESTRKHGGFWQSTTENRLGALEKGSLNAQGVLSQGEGYYSSLQRKNVYAAVVYRDTSLEDDFS